ncbi:MAG TPA: protein kinase [Lacipirellulaceae bacterium]|nr:protein kinase [Lacipirellulaceae bacterium]
MTESVNDPCEVIEQLVESFVMRLRAGEQPRVNDYLQQYPEHAEQLADMLPAIIILEQHAARCSLENFEKESHAQLPIPDEFGDFAIVREVGRGGMGIVYEAVQRSLNRHVALKIMSLPAFANTKHLERFRFEARSAARLQHNHIVPVFGVGEFQGMHYYVMQFIRGRSLHQLISALRESERSQRTADGKTQTDSAASEAYVEDTSSATGFAITAASGREFYRTIARIGLQVSQALSYAHSEGVLHRDIKPSNLLLDAKGDAWITDFGLAKVEGSDGLTETGDFLGTLRYMAPERLEGVLDRRSDIYSLGATLYELLTLHTFQESNSRAQLVDQIFYQLPKAPTKIDPTIPRDLETIVLKATAKEPAARYRTAEEMAEDLSRYLADRTILARRSTTKERFVRWCRRSPLVASLTAAVMLVLVVGIIGTSLGLLQARQQRAEAEIARDDAVTARKAADREAQRADEQTKLASEKADALKRLVNYVSAQYALSQGRLDEAYQQITSAIKSKPMWEYGHLLATIVAEARKDWQPAARIFCKTVPRWGCFVGSGPKWLVVSAGDFITVYSAADGQKIKSSKPLADGGPTCSMGRDRLAVSTTGGQVAIYSLPELQVCGLCQMPDSVIAIRSDADGKHLAILDVKGTVRVFDEAAQQLAEHQFPLAQGYSRGSSIDISPSGSAVLFDPVGQETEKRSLWKWATNKIRTFSLDANVLRLQSDDKVVGIVTPISSSETSQLAWLDLNDSNVRTYTFPNILYAPETRLEGVAISKGVVGISLVSNDLISSFPTSIGKTNSEPSSNSDAQIGHNTTHDSVARYHSLWPQRAETPKLLAFDAASQSLALAEGREIVVFGKTQRSTRGQASNTMPMDSWSVGTAGGNALFATEKYLQIVNFHLNQSVQVAVEPPSPLPGRAFHIWGVTGTPDGRRVAVRWQETSGNTSDAATYFRKIVRVYESVPATDEKSRILPLVGEVDFKELGGIHGDTNKQIVLSPDGNTVACVARGKCAGYRVDNAAKKYEIEVDNRGVFATCQDPPLFGAGRYDQPDNFIIWDIQDGNEISRFKLDAPIRTAAFSPNGKLVFIGLKSNVLRSYRVKDGERVSEIHTAVAPKAIPPVGTRFLGFLSNGATGTLGSMVVADLEDGHVLEVLNRAAHVLDAGYCTNDAGAFVYAIDRTDAEVARSVSIDEAVQILEQTSPPLLKSLP